MARQTLHETMGRLASYEPPEGSSASPGNDLNVRCTSAVEEIELQDLGGMRHRSVTVQVQIGTGAGMLERVQLGGRFMLDVDGENADVPWTVYSFPNTDIAAGFVRCLLIQPIQQNLVVGAPRPRK